MSSRLCFASLMVGDRGITTVVVLLILLVLSLIGIAGMAVSTTEIRIAGNQYRSSQAFHAADAGQRVALQNAALQNTLSAIPTANFDPGITGTLNSGVVETATYTVTPADAPVRLVSVREYPCTGVNDVDYLCVDYLITSQGTAPGGAQKRIEIITPVNSKQPGQY